MAIIKRVSYAWNSALEDAGQPGYFFDCLISRDGFPVVDRHESYKSREEFYSAIDDVLPMLGAGDDISIPN